MNVACVGDNCIDRYLATGESQVGGNALNVAVGLAQAGLQTMYCGAVGDDEDGRMIRAALDAQGVSTAWLETRPEPTAVTLVELRETGDRVFAEEHFGASGAYRPGPEVLAQLDGCAWVHAAGLEDPGMLLQLEHAPLSYDFSDAPDADQVATLAPRLDVAFVSAGGRDRAAASAQARELVAAGAGMAVVTRGGDGAMAWNGKLVERSAEPVDVVDTLGAGDALIAGVIAARVGGLDIAAALDHGARAAARACTHHGAWEAA